MTLQEKFKHILTQYKSAQGQPFAGNELAFILRNELPENLTEKAYISKQYLVDGSAGQGNWAEVPWVGVFDHDITKSAQRGFYIVYLFDADMQGVYLSLNQGWTQYEEQYGTREGRVAIKNNAEKFQSILRSTNNDFSFTPIALHATHTLGQGYELGHICGVYYQKELLPADNVLVDDLRNLIGVYRELKAIVGKNILNIETAYEDFQDLGEQSHVEEKLLIDSVSDRIKTADDLNHALEELESSMRHKVPRIVQRIARTISRNVTISRLIKERAQYRCEICGMPGFQKNNGEPYAEVHHMQELWAGGADLPSNLICVCPTCHRVLHYGSQISLDERKKSKS